MGILASSPFTSLSCLQLGEIKLFKKHPAFLKAILTYVKLCQLVFLPLLALPVMGITHTFCCCLCLDIQVLMGSLVYLRQGIENSPYVHLLDANQWADICDIFTRDACALLGLSVESPLSVRYGTKSPFCFLTAMLLVNPGC